ncbi:hypothetical protein [Phormidesmis priestleyi]|nr:hypothetical protein [Phormidesmis priestleyi]
MQNQGKDKLQALANSLQNQHQIQAYVIPQDLTEPGLLSGGK